MKHLLSPKAFELAAEFLRISEEIAAEGARVESKTIEEPTMNQIIGMTMTEQEELDYVCDWCGQAHSPHAPCEQNQDSDEDITAPARGHYLS